jgi:hypothetical protein
MSDYRNHKDRQLPTSGISVGDIRNATGIVVGHGSASYVNTSSASTQHDALELLDKFILALAQHHTEIDDPAAIEASADLARTELERPSPRWHAVRSLLTGIATGVTSVSALTDLISRILALIPR